MTEREYASVAQMKGSLSQQSCPDPGAFERANYMKALKSYTSDVRRRASTEPRGDHHGTSDQ